MRGETGERGFFVGVNLQDFGEAEQFDDLVDAVRHVQEFDVAALFARQFSETDERAEAGAADVIEFFAVEENGVVRLLELRVELGLQARERIHIQRAGEPHDLDGAVGFLVDAKVFHGDLRGLRGLTGAVAQVGGEVFELGEIAAVGGDEIVVRFEHQIGGIVFVERLSELGRIRVR